MSLVMRKPAFCICENKDADQLRGNREADQRLCFRYTDSTLYFLNAKFQASSHLLWLYSLVYVRPGRQPRRPVFSERGSNSSKAQLHRLDYCQYFYIKHLWSLYQETKHLDNLYYCVGLRYCDSFVTGLI